MQNVLHQNPLSAWKHLCSAGGIELDGRDEGLDKKIHLALNPSSRSLEDALSGATMNEFLSAFFAGIHPFILIFRDILDFFENADATKGQAQWMLQVDNVDVSLEHFRDWIETWSKIENVKQEVSALVFQDTGELLGILRKPNVVEKQLQLSLRNELLSLPQDVQEWTRAYNSGKYLPLPKSLSSPDFPGELRESVSIAQAIASILINSKMTQGELRQTLVKQAYPQGESMNSIDFWAIVHRETDYLLRSLVIALSSCGTLLKPVELAELSVELNTFIDKYPKVPLEMEIHLSDFDSILSLPIWKKRYELYSVWIATEIIKALHGHNIELHHDKGRIAFAFHETLIATVHSAKDPFILVSERRSPLFDPIGKGRSSAVQPDYGLWKTRKGQEDCAMVIEVKHYKKSSKKNFVDLFVDYARAFCLAEVYLVNHGPTGKVIEGVKSISTNLANRCHPIQHLTPLNTEAREKFAVAVRKCIGEPQKVMLVKNQGVVKTVVFDVSASMNTLLNSSAADELKSSILGIDQLQNLVAVDYRLVGNFPVSEAGFADLLKSGGGYTDLKRAVQTLLIDNSIIIIVTDTEGLETLNGLNVVTHEYQKYAPKELKICVCIK
ncbi:hypothetical protein [Spirosoma validum]|uniref:Uncharacterized protein n=1 Tax=Spirosoma validum TaxID=2771355 RepID=A0A927GCI3_9BACT|nr:hypothetical protein [Spirosoma validum]MBD2752501.1 hypothetical protein [Spirosoma validum]